MRRALPLLLAALAFVALTVLWIVSDPRASQRVYDTYSSANTSGDGLSLASGYLARGRKVAMLTRPLGRAPLERNAVVFRVHEKLSVFFDPEELADKAGPPQPHFQPLLDDASEAFVRAGGRIVLAAAEGALPTSGVSSRTAQKVLPLWPAAGDLRLGEDARAFAQLPARMLPVYVAGDAAILARQRIGAGELFVLSAPELLRNEDLHGNLALLDALAGDRRPVYFDEVMHGIVSDDGALALMKEWNLGPFLAMLAAAAMLLFWREGRRIGPAEEDVRETRSEAIDLVRSLGALYDEVTSDAEAIALYHDALTRTVAHKSGLRGEALRKRVDALTGGLVPPRKGGRMPRAVFQQQLDALNSAFRGM